MSMDKKIFLPDAEQMGKFIENSWQTFKKQAAESGFVLDSNPNTEAFAKDMFVSGYCYGYNDCLEIVRGQLQAMDLVNDLFPSKKNEAKE